MVRVTILNARERTNRIDTLVAIIKKCKEEDREINKEDLYLYMMEKFNCSRRTAIEYYKVAEVRYNK